MASWTLSGVHVIVTPHCQCYDNKDSNYNANSYPANHDAGEGLSAIGFGWSIISRSFRDLSLWIKKGKKSYTVCSSNFGTIASNPAPSHERAWYTLFTHVLDFHTFPWKVNDWSMGEHAFLLLHAKNSVYTKRLGRRLIWDIHAGNTAPTWMCMDIASLGPLDLPLLVVVSNTLLPPSCTHFIVLTLFPCIVPITTQGRAHQHPKMAMAMIDMMPQMIPTSPDAEELECWALVTLVGCSLVISTVTACCPCWINQWWAVYSYREILYCLCQRVL